MSIWSLKRLKKTAFLGLVAAFVTSCATDPFPDYSERETKFPSADVYTGEPPTGRPYKAVGWIRVKSTFASMVPSANIVQKRCVNEFNRAAVKLLERAKKKHGGDAVIRVQSVVFTLTGDTEKFPRPECTDDGEMADITVEGLVVNWKAPEPAAVPAAPLTPAQKPKSGGKKPRRKVMAPAEETI